MKTVLSLYLEVEIAEVLKNEARRNDQSLSSFIAAIATEHAAKLNPAKVRRAIRRTAPTELVPA